MSASSVSILLLGSGWTSRFLLPILKSEGISYAYTRRTPVNSGDVHAFSFEVAKEGKSNLSSFQALPKADLVLIVFPLTSSEFVDNIVETYEEAKACQPAWLALGSTGAWSKGIITSSSPVVDTNIRAVSEGHLLSLNTKTRPTVVLNLAGLYGGERNPVNFAKKVGETMEKLEGKTSLHLVHGKDVGQAIVGMWEALQDTRRKEALWGKRWIVTDTHVYDWWQLFTTLRPSPKPQSSDWVKELTSKHSIVSLPRPAIGQGGERDVPPYVLDRAMDGKTFWKQLGKAPLIGRCDDYSLGGGGRTLQEEGSLRESL